MPSAKQKVTFAFDGKVTFFKSAPVVLDNMPRSKQQKRRNNNGRARCLPNFVAVRSERKGDLYDRAIVAVFSETYIRRILNDCHCRQRSMIFRKTKYRGGSVYARRKELAKTRQSECRAEELSVLVCFSKVKRLI